MSKSSVVTLCVPPQKQTARSLQPPSERNPFVAVCHPLHISRCIVYPIRIGRSSQPVNLVVVSTALAFCSINGFLQAQQYCRFRSYAPDHHTTPTFVFGSVLWLLGFGINTHSDSHLRTLRNTPPVNAYKIPRGGLFRYVSCANFLGEILEWLGYAIASDSIAGWAFWAWVCANLVPRGISHHGFYQMKFEDYPNDRWAVVPFFV